MIDLEIKHRVLVLKLSTTYLPDYQGFVFGSRVSGRARRFSDLDIALIGKLSIPMGRLADLREALSASVLPIFVDLIDLQSVSEDWRARVSAAMVPLNFDKGKTLSAPSG